MSTLLMANWSGLQKAGDDDRSVLQSYRFFVEHAYNKFFQHEAFNQSARARTKAKDFGAAGTFHTLTKPDGYIWIGSKDNLLHVPKDQADDVEITESDIAKEVEDTLPRVEVKVRPRPQEEEKKEDVSSQQEEETSQHAGHAENAKIPAMPRGRTAEERYGNLIIQQLTPEHQEQLRMCAFNSRNVLGAEDRDPERDHQTPDQVSSFGTVFMMERTSFETHSPLMEHVPEMTQTPISYGSCHELCLDDKVLEENRHIKVAEFEEEDEPEMPEGPRDDRAPGDPEYKGAVEHLAPENKHLIPETDDNSLIECAVQWLNMYDKDLQKRIMERV
jgi:hypothetical protein